MLVDAQIFRDPSYSPCGAGDGGSTKRRKAFKCGILVWKDGDVEWTIEVWDLPVGYIVIIRENGKPTQHTSLRWKRAGFDQVDELVISKISEGRFTNETAINIKFWLAGWHIDKIMKSVTVGQVSDNLPVIL